MSVTLTTFPVYVLCGPLSGPVFVFKCSVLELPLSTNTLGVLVRVDSTNCYNTQAPISQWLTQQTYFSLTQWFNVGVLGWVTPLGSSLPAII